MPAGVTRLAPAKVNLYLGVHPETDARGYHRVNTVMAALGLCDEVTVERAQRLSLSCDANLGIPPERNIAWRAAELLGRETGNEPLVRIHIRKRIPSQAGLGGGSSDAAAALLALCELWDADPNAPQVRRVARALGADVPFFLDPAPTLLTGAGDVPAERFDARLGLPIALVQAPSTGVPTPAAYAEFDRRPPERAELEPLLNALRAADADAVVANLANNLQPVAERLRPAIAEVRLWLESRAEVREALVCGSGGCVFAVCESAEGAKRTAAEAKARGWWAEATEVA